MRTILDSSALILLLTFYWSSDERYSLSLLLSVSASERALSLHSSFIATLHFMLRYQETCNEVSFSFSCFHSIDHLDWITCLWLSCSDEARGHRIECQWKSSSSLIGGWIGCEAVARLTSGTLCISSHWTFAGADCERLAMSCISEISSWVLDFLPKGCSSGLLEFESISAGMVGMMSQE